MDPVPGGLVPLELAGTSEHILVVQHLAGSMNFRADKLSRHCIADHEWRLHPEVIQSLFHA